MSLEKITRLASSYALNARMGDAVRLEIKKHLWKRQRNIRISRGSVGRMIFADIVELKKLSLRYGPKTRLIDAITAELARRAA